MKYVLFLIFGLLAFFLLIMLISSDKSGSNEFKSLTLKCSETYCIEESIDNFAKCIELGKERIGFLTYEKYHLCDGIKIVNKCLKYEKREDFIDKINVSLPYIVPYNCEVINRDFVNQEKVE